MQFLMQFFNTILFILEQKLKKPIFMTHFSYDYVIKFANFVYKKTNYIFQSQINISRLVNFNASKSDYSNTHSAK